MAVGTPLSAILLYNLLISGLVEMKHQLKGPGIIWVQVKETTEV